MNFGAFSYAYSTNLGDEIQTLAATQYLPRVDVLLERDRLYRHRGTEPIFAIFNGWFTEQRSWPPPDSITPLFVAFHPAIPKLLVSEKYASYFKLYEPIGCRSMDTVQIFRNIGVDAYFSGCLTLTLQKRLTEKTDQIYAVDVDPELFHALVPKEIRKIAIHVAHDFPSLGEAWTTKAKWNAAYYGLRGMQKWDSGQAVLGRITTKLNEFRHTFRVAKAEELLKAYSGARLVITSRLHCAMPCLAQGTPVILLRRHVDEDPRFAGLRDLVRTYSDAGQPIKIDWRHPEPNSDAYEQYAKSLRMRCQEAVRQAMNQTENDPSEAARSAESESLHQLAK